MFEVISIDNYPNFPLIAYLKLPLLMFLALTSDISLAMYLIPPYSCQVNTSSDA